MDDIVLEANEEIETDQSCDYKLSPQEQHAKAILNILFKQAKQERKLTQTQLQHLTGYTQGTISNHLRGKGPITQKAILIYAKTFGVPPSLFDPRLAYLNPVEEMTQVDDDKISKEDEKAPVLHDCDDISEFLMTGAHSATDEAFLLPHLRGRRAYAIRGGDLRIPGTFPNDYLIIDRKYRPTPAQHGIWILKGVLHAGTTLINDGSLYLLPTPPITQPIYLGDWDERFVGTVVTVYRIT